MALDQSSWTHKRWVSLLERLHEIVEVAKTMARILERVVELEGRMGERVAELDRRVTALEGREQEPPGPG